jgi:hypothetical protein
LCRCLQAEALKPAVETRRAAAALGQGVACRSDEQQSHEKYGFELDFERRNGRGRHIPSFGSLGELR